MGREWKIGDPVDYTSDGWMDAQNWTGDYYIENDDPDNDKSQKASAISDKAWKLYEERRYNEALILIDEALSYYDRYFNDWNRKAIILENLRRYEESKECYDRAIALYRNEVVIKNKVMMLRKWANDLYFSSKDLPKALTLVDEAISEMSSLSQLKSDIPNYRNFAGMIEDRIRAIENSKKSKEYNNLKNSLSGEVIRELTWKGHTLQSQIYCLMKFIDDFERDMDCIFNRVYYTSKAVSGIRPGSGFVSGLLIEFDKSRKFLNSKITSDYYPGQDHVDFDQMCVETIDENYLFAKEELSKLRKTMEKDGYTYQGILIMEETLVIIFTKNDLLKKEFDFSLKEDKITFTREFIDIAKCYYSYKCPESEIIRREVKRIENEYGCSLVHIEPPATLYFNKKYGHGELICEYDIKTKKIEILSKTF